MATAHYRRADPADMWRFLLVPGQPGVKPWLARGHIYAAGDVVPDGAGFFQHFPSVPFPMTRHDFSMDRQKSWLHAALVDIGFTSGSLGSPREWFWDDSGARKMDRGRVEGQEKHGLCRVSATVHPRPVHFSRLFLGSWWTSDIP